MQDKTLADLENGLRKNRINTGFSSNYAASLKVELRGIEPLSENQFPVLLLS